MPKAMTDKDRLLAFAFRAGLEELQEARAVIDAAIRAKSGGRTRATAAPRKRAPKPTDTKDADNPTE